MREIGVGKCRALRLGHGSVLKIEYAKLGFAQDTPVRRWQAASDGRHRFVKTFGLAAQVFDATRDSGRRRDKEHQTGNHKNEAKGNWRQQADKSDKA